MRYVVLTPLLLIAVNSFTQDCSKELLKDKPGVWKTGTQGQIVNVNAANLVKEKTVTTSIHKMIAARYSPKGCQVLYATVYGKHLSAASNWIADPYYYSMYILRYLCDQNSADKTKHYIDISTPTTVNIVANAIYWLNTLYAADLAGDDFRGYLKLRQRPQLQDGAYYMGEEIMGNANGDNKIKEYRWLVTYNDTLPFLYISRKEYLLIQKKRLERSLVENPGEKPFLDKYLKNINDYLKKPEPELSKHAVCMWNDEERFEQFVEEGTRNSFIAIKPNPAYYRKKLPMSSPQFITVVYKIAHGDPVFEENIISIKKAVDFAELKNLLGK